MTPRERERHGAVGARLATRLARHEVLRRPGRTLLVALLVAMPVAGMLVADVLVRTEHETPLQLWRNEHGQADAILAYVTAPPTGPSRIATLIGKSRVVAGASFLDGRVLRTVSSRRSDLLITRLAMTDPLTRGIVQVMSGRAPKRGNEVFLTRTAAHQLGLTAGDTLRLESPARTSLRVTGVGELATEYGQMEMILPPGARLPWKPLPNVPPVQTQLVDLPAVVRPAELKQLLASHDAAKWGLQISPALVSIRTYDFTHADAEKKVRWSWVIGALVLTVAGIVISAAFAVGARRQLVTLGQLAANGAPPKMLRRMLFLQGTLTGIAGALLGVGLGAGALAVLASHIDQIFRKDLQPYNVRPSDLVPIIVLGVITATIAALLPARTTSRIPVLAALSGRRPLGHVPKWLPITGACVAAGGLGLFGLAVLGGNSTNNGSNTHWQVWAFTAIAGGVAVLMGACAVAPSYVSVLEPAATLARGSCRIAMRSLARQRTRTGAVVSAIAATGALAIAASALTISAHAYNDRSGRYIRADEVQIKGEEAAAGDGAPPASLVAAEQKVLPNATRFQIIVPARPETSWEIRRIVADHPDKNGTVVDVAGSYTSAAIADRATIAEYGLSDHDRDQLTTRGALLLGPVNGRAVIALVTHVATNKGVPAPKNVNAAVSEQSDYQIGSLPSLLVTPHTAKRLGMTRQLSTVVLRNPKALSRDQRNRTTEVMTNAFEDAGQDGLSASINYYAPPGGVDPLLIQWALVGISLILVLFVVAVNLALSATETRDERDVLTIVGAAPRAMREANGYKAILLTLMGALLAIPVGFLPVAVFISANTRDLPLIFPWRVVLALVVGLPVVAGLITAAASGVALRFRPVRISTMAYD